MGRTAELAVAWMCLCCVIYQSRGTDCDEGLYGDQCNILCSTISQGCIQCTKDGQCTACSYQKKPPKCTVCKDGYYKSGSGCDQCSSYCKDRLCDPDNGTCIDCPEGQYGALCHLTCSSNCTDLACHRNTGKCLNCPEGQYGALCHLTCSSNCTDLACHRNTGKCLSCAEGHYGDQCSFSCSSITDHCIQCTQDGQCTACSGHFKPPNCTECKAGLFGETCSEQCGHCHSNVPCHHVTGHCLTGCKRGFTGPLCVQQSEQQEGSKSPVVIGAVLGVLLIAIVVVIAVVIIIIRRRRQAEKTKCDEVQCVGTTGASELSTDQSHGNVTGESDYTAPSTDDYLTPVSNPYTEAYTSSSSSDLNRAALDLPATSESNLGVEESFYYEIVERENTYDQLHPYSNTGGERGVYSKLTSRDTDVTAPAASSAYANMAFKE